MATIITRFIRSSCLIWLSTFLLSLCASPSAATDLTDVQLAEIDANLASGAHDPWELGTRAQAVTELHAPSFSVFSSTKLPLASSMFAEGVPSSLDSVLDLAHTVVANRSVSNGGITGPQPLIQNGAAGDPPSMGVAVLLANWTLGPNGGNGKYGGVDYEGAAKDQLDFLFEKVPKTDDGAISHRTEQVQLWSDFVYMVPPFLAYYGITTGNQSLVEEAYNQCKLYRSYLMDPSAGGMWKHVLMGDWEDQGHWASGNGWAAAGMLRVLTTMQNSDFADALKGEQNDLATWVQEIHDGIYPYLQVNGIFRNYPGQPYASNNFDDAASAALLAASVYRLAVALDVSTHIADAERSRLALLGPNTNVTNVGSDFEHFTSDFWLTPVVYPYDFGLEGQHSPESQAFVLEMEAARKDWVSSGSPGLLGGSSRKARMMQNKST